MISRRDATTLLVVCSVIAVRSACGTTRHVPADYATIQLAIDAAAVGDTIEVACGTYHEHDIVVSKGLFLTSETGLPDCVTVDAEQQGRVMFFNTSPDSATIQGFTIRGGSAQDGAGISCLSSRLRLEQCLFEDNEATRDGGALVCDQGYVIGMECRFQANTASAGGGVFINYAGAAFAGCTFAGNAASGAYDPHDGGGAIATGTGMGDRSEFDNCVFTNNSAPFGGAIYGGIETSTTLRHCVVSGNTASYGGGLYGTPYLHGTFTVDYTAITCNVATVRGGGASLYHSTVRNSTIAGNFGGVGGGAAAYSVCRFENSVLWGNCSADGAQLYVNAEFPASTAQFSCSLVDTSAGWLATGLGSGGAVQWTGINHFTDPLFCGPLACDGDPATGGDYAVAGGSLCLPENSGGCGLIGCYGLGSCSTALDPLTWSRLKTRFR